VRVEIQTVVDGAQELIHLLVHEGDGLAALSLKQENPVWHNV
jgi:hypothetical protein